MKDSELDEIQTSDTKPYVLLTNGEEAAWEQFLRLCSDTRKDLEELKKAAKIKWLPSIYSPLPDSGWNVGMRLNANSDIAKRWKEWNEVTYPAMEARQPLLKLVGLMKDISESHDACSWPWGYELKIRDWVNSDFELPIPFDDRYNIVDEIFRRDLAITKKRCGGWLTQDVIDGVSVYTFIKDEVK